MDLSNSMGSKYQRVKHLRSIKIIMNKNSFLHGNKKGGKMPP